MNGAFCQEVKNSNGSALTFEVPGSFRIMHLPLSGNGLKIETVDTLSGATLASDSISIPEQFTQSESEREAYFNAMAREAGFLGLNVDAIKELEAAFDCGQIDETTYRMQRTQLNDRYIEHSRGAGYKVGLRDIELDADTVRIKSIPVPYFAYDLLSTPEASDTERWYAEITGTASVAITTDNRIILQHRSTRNSQYPDTAGASVAGAFDAEVVSDDITGEIFTKPIDESDAIRNSNKEASEELGVDPYTIDTQLIGLAYDERKPHHELLLVTHLPMDIKRLRTVSRQSKINQNLGDADFEEKYFDIEASADAIFTLLSEVKSLMPTTHNAAFIAVGYMLKLEESGIDSASVWKNNLEKAIIKNIADIDERVRQFYVNNPEQATNVPERFHGALVPHRNLNAYSPAYLPEEQGLPNLLEELLRTNLLTIKTDEH